MASRKTTKKGKGKAQPPIRPPEPENAWDLQPDESKEAFEAFRIYLLLGGERSTARVGQQLGKSKTLMDRWSSRHRWVARATAFDAEAAKRQDEGVLDVLAERAKRQAELAQVATEAMAAPSIELMRRLRDDPEALKKMDLEELTRIAATTARAFPRIQAAERLARGQPTTNVGPRGGGLPGDPESNRQAAERAAAQRRVEDMPTEALDALLSGAATHRGAEKRKPRTPKGASK